MATRSSHSSHPTPKKHLQALQSFLRLAVVAVFVMGSVGVGVATNGVSESFQASVIKAKSETSQRKVASYLAKRKVAQAEKADPAVVKCTDVSKDAAAYKGEFVARSVTFNTKPQQNIKVSLYLKNTGTTPWLGDSSGCVDAPIMRLGTAKSRDHKSIFYTESDAAWRGANRIAMKEMRIEPNEIATFTFILTTPSNEDIYKEFLQPVVEGVKWMEDRSSTAEMLVHVGASTAELERKAFLLGHAGAASKLDTSGELVFDVNLTTQRAQVQLGNQVLREYVVSTGAWNTPTPSGRFKVLTKQELRIGAAKPHYRMPHFQLLTNNGVGVHALAYLANDKGLFWNEALSNIGRRVSHGCVRLLPDDALDFYKITDIGTTVVIHF